MAAKKEGTAKRTKSEIQEDYESLKSRLEDMTSGTAHDRKVDEVVKLEEKKNVERASAYTVEAIVKGLAELSLNTGKAISDLTEKLVAESQKLAEIRKAIETETRHLEEVRNINVVADALVLLINEYETKKRAYHEEMEQQERELSRLIDEKRNQWKKEQEFHEQMVKDRDAMLAKERQREKEEYEYTVALARKKDKDAYEQKKAELERELRETRNIQEKDLAGREAALSAREKELEELRKKAETFQATLDEAVKKAVTEATKAAEKKAEIEAKIFAKEVEGERNLLKLEIKTFQESVKRQEAEMEALRKELVEANRQVMTIATQAIEGASGSRTLSTVQEIAMEQAKMVKS